MKKMIVLVGLVLSLSAFAQEETGWKAKARSLITSLTSASFAANILGPAPVVEVSQIVLPVIPKQIKKSTDVGNYTKQKKDPVEFDRLPKERQRNFNYVFLQELFRVTRKAEAKDEDLSNWINVLDQGGSREGIYQALTLDEVYASLEDISERPSERLLDFSLKFSQRFFNQTFNKESLLKLNSYSLKRILTEKGLDIIEYYEVNNLEDLYKWYAVFSAELAQEYAPLLKTELRKDPRVEYHLAWAKNSPVQHIKSEFIIKLHTVMNGLQLLE